MRRTLPAETVLAALQSRTHLEQKRQTQDGAIWPFPRAEMRSARRIRERMQEDAMRLLHGGETCLTVEDFRRLGWRREQIETHGREAMASLSVPETIARIVAPDPVPPGVVALGLLAFATATWAFVEGALVLLADLSIPLV